MRDGLTRNVLFAAANVMPSRSHQWTALKVKGHVPGQARLAYEGEDRGGAKARRPRDALPRDGRGEPVTRRDLVHRHPGDQRLGNDPTLDIVGPPPTRRPGQNIYRATGLHQAPPLASQGDPPVWMRRP